MKVADIITESNMHKNILASATVNGKELTGLFASVDQAKKAINVAFGKGGLLSRKLKFVPFGSYEDAKGNLVHGYVVNDAKFQPIAGITITSSEHAVKVTNTLA